MSIIEELAAEVGRPLASATLLPQPSPAVMVFNVDTPGPPPRRILVGKCLGRIGTDGPLLSQVGNLVIERLVAALTPAGTLVVCEISSRERTRSRAEMALANAEEGTGILFVTTDERILAQLTYLLGFRGMTQHTSTAGSA